MMALPATSSQLSANLMLKSASAAPALLPSIVTKVYELTMRFFGLGQNFFLVAFGVKELLVDYGSYAGSLSQKRGPPKLVQEVADDAFSHFKKVQGVYAEYSMVHGGFYLGSGIFGGVASMHGLQWIDLGKQLPFVQNVASGLFLYVNLYSLEQNIKLFYHAEELLDSGKEEFRTFANRLKASAVMGIINNIGYIIATLASFLPQAVTLAIAMGCFAFFVGTLKIIYDYVWVGPQFSQLAGD